MALTEEVEQVIYLIRNQKVIIDNDLAVLYGVETKNLNKAVKRNLERFPIDFMFQLEKEEWERLRFQIGTSKGGRGGKRYMPYAFTEEGVAMLSGILHSPQAVGINIAIMRAFVRMRHVMNSQQKINKELAEIKSFLLKHSHSTDREFRKVWQTIEKLSQKPTQEDHKIGFQLS